MLNSEIKIAIVVSMFNQEITENLLEGALSRLLEKGVRRQNIRVSKVPGAIEIPLTALWFAQKREYQAIIALGAVIRGETGHYDYVCEQVSQGCQKVMLDFSLPVVFGVLTAENEAQAIARSSDQDNKGREAADVALHMISLAEELETIKA